MAKFIRIPLIAGFILAVMVNLLIYFELPGFDPREGIFGTDFLSALLYAIDDDWLALAIVTGLYFNFGFIVGCFISAFRINRKSAGHEEQEN